ncbi:MAG: hypothetical protein KBG15_02565 [Kofleriaceae bacterium]|nr:hypothetical protein [Kofleriaceae bacterium]
MVSRRDLLLGLGASVVALAALPGCRPTAPMRPPQPSTRDVEAWAISAVDELVRHGTAAWCNVIRTRRVELVLDVVGESQALATTWQLQLGITRVDGSSEIRTIDTISQHQIELAVAALIGAPQWVWSPSRRTSPAIQAYGALQPVVDVTLPPPWRAALERLHASFVPLLHSHIIYHSVALQQQTQERWSYHRRSEQPQPGQKFAATITRQLWQCTTATRQRGQLDFSCARRGSSEVTPTPGFTDEDLQDLINRALRHATPSDPPRGAVRVLLTPDFTATVLIAAQTANLAVPHLQFDPLQPNAYGRTALSVMGLPLQSPTSLAPADTTATGLSASATWRAELDGNEPAHVTIAGGTADVTTLRNQPDAVYLLEAGDVSVSHTGDVMLWPTWALEIEHGATSGRAYRSPIVRTTVVALVAAQASSERGSVLVPAPPAVVSAATSTVKPTTMWSATAPWILLPAEFA